VLERLGDDLGLAKAWRVLAYAQFAMGDSMGAQRAAERAITSAQRAGDERLEARIVRLNCLILFWGPTPLGEVSAYVGQALEWARQRGALSLEALALNVKARVTAMQRRFDEARKLCESAESIPVDLGEMLSWAAGPLTAGLIELLADNLVAAEEALSRACDIAEKKRGRGPLANLTVMRARALLLLRRDEEAGILAARCSEMAPDSQIDVQIRQRGVQAVILARRGTHDGARRLADEAVQMAEGSQQPDTQATALMDLANVMRFAQQWEDSRRVARRALDLYRSKGNLAGETVVKRFLTDLMAAESRLLS
jgi:tetratricopeptide (TPR) repeat protein